jgi:membrane protein
MVVVMALLPVGGVVSAWIAKRGYLDKDSPLLWAFDVSRWALALVFLITVLALVYYFGVNVKHKFYWLTPGAVFCLAAWVVLGLGFRYYVERFGHFNKTYGAVGGVAILLLLFYLDSAVLMIGAEINSEIDFEVLKVRRGTRNFLPAETKAEEETKHEVEKATRPLRRFISRLTARFARRRPGSSGSTPTAP